MLQTAGIEDPLIDIVLRTMALAPKDRFQTAVELRAAIRGWYNALDPSHIGKSKQPIAVGEVTEPVVDLHDEIQSARDLYRTEGDYEAAEKKLKRILARHDTDPKVYLEFARFYNSSLRRADALDILERGIDTAGADYAPLWLARGVQYAERGSKENAVRAFEKALELGLAGKDASLAKLKLRSLKSSSA